MKIAIQGHLSRGHEVIQILESLGGKSRGNLTGRRIEQYYFINSNGDIDLHYQSNLCTYKLYTLEEFEKEFPFKVGDKVKHISSVGTIKEYCYINNEPAYKVESMELGIIANIPAKILEPYKEMKEERNITLTLDKAKEWYNKGGELKEIALQAFTERELNPLPKSWEKYCRKYGYGCLSTRYTNIPLKYDALLKLEQLRDCWRQGNIPQEIKYKIRKVRNIYTVVYGAENAFLSFCDNQTAEEFLECFRDLIEQAGDLI